MSTSTADPVACEPRTAFVLAGGAVLGAMQAGMVRALYERGIAPDLLIGTSAGALNAAFLASRPATVATAQELAALWRGLRRSDILPLRPATLISGLAGRRDHLIPDRALRRLAARHLQFDRLEQAAIPLHLIAFDLLAGTEVRLSDGPLADAVLAAAAIPGVLPPVRWRGRLLVDGGIADNTPVSHAVALGARRIYVLPTQNPGDRGLPAPGRAGRRGARDHRAHQRPPPRRPRPLRPVRRADRAARRQPRAHPAQRLRPRRPADHAGADSRPGGTHRPVRPARRWRAQSPPGCRPAGPGGQATLMAETPGPSGSLPGHGRARVQAPARLLRRRGWRRIARLAAIAAIEEFRANGGRVGGPWAGTIRESYGGHRPRRHPRGLTLAVSTRTGPAAVISGLSRIGRFPYTRTTGGPAKIIASANGRTSTRALKTRPPPRAQGRPRRAGSPPSPGPGPGHHPAAPFWRIPVAPQYGCLRSRKAGSAIRSPVLSPRSRSRVPEPGPCPRGPGFLMAPGHRASSGPRRRPAAG